MEWELTKENCVPVRQGRSGAALQELADPAAEALETKRRELWSAVINYQGDDPLDAWQKYIKWMQEYGVGGGKADLQRVLETCTKELQKLERYNNDIRYLRIWITYADCLPDPADVFLFLKEKGIGQDFALYYDAYATYFELKGSFQSADAVFMDGVKRGAKPLERLQQKHTAFQQRMAHRMQRSMEDEQLMGSRQPEPARSSLAILNGHGSRTARTAGQQRVIGAAGPQPAPLFGSKPSQLSMRGPRLGVGVLEDEEFADAENAVGLPGYSCMPQVNNLRELKPYGIIRKENLDRPTTWGQALFPTASTAATGPSASGGLEIFTDEEFQGEEEEFSGLPTSQAGRIPIGFGRAASTAGASAGHPLLAPLTGGSAASGVDSLMSSLALPPSLLRGSQPAGALPPRAQSIFPAAAQSAAGPCASGGYGVRSEAPSSKLDVQSCGNAPSSRPVTSSAVTVTVGPSTGPAETSATEQQAADSTEELSYEELRAVAWYRRHPVSDMPANDPENMPSSPEKRSMKRSHAVALGTESVAAVAGIGLASTGRPPADMTGQAAASAPAGRRKPFVQMASSAAPAQPENINDDINGVATAASGRPPGAAPSLATAPPAENPSWKTSRTALSQHPSGVPAACVPPATTMPALASNAGTMCGRENKHEDPQATITISTRGAFDLLNSFFSEDLPHQQQRRAQCGKLSSQGGAQSQAMAAPVPLDTSTRAPALAPQAPPAFAPEATVTLHTRQAFDTLNDMFNETLPHEAARKLARRAGFDGSITYSKPISTSDVCRLANAGRSFGGGSTGMLGNGGPSNPIGAPVAATAGPSSQAPLSIHEDTFFLGPPASAAPAGGENRFGCPEEQALGMGGIYEDTDFLPKAPARGGFGRDLSSNAGAPGEVLVLEDTDFLTRPQVAPPFLGSSGSHVSHGNSSTSHNVAPNAAKLQVRDSSRVSVAQPAPAGARRPLQSRPTGSLLIYEDTQYLE